LGKLWGESGNSYGVIASDLHNDFVKELETKHVAKLETDEGGASLGTYVAPCRSFGILANPPSDSHLPIIITSRGRKLYDVRKSALLNNPITKIILNGGKLHLEHLKEYGRYFSVNGLLCPDCKTERDLLEEYMFLPYSNSENVLIVYDRFRATVQWAFQSLKPNEAGYTTDLIAECYRSSCKNKSTLRPVAVAWTEYELRRRCHFAFELFLKALANMLNLLGGANLGECINSYVQEFKTSEGLKEIIDINKPFSKQLSDFRKAIKPNAFLDSPVDRGSIQNCCAGAMALYALCILLSCEKHTKTLRSESKLTDRSEESNGLMELSFKILSESKDLLVRDVVANLTLQTAIEPHLFTTWRKMRQKQKCSLRFYPEGNILRPIEQKTKAGYSGPRLGNVLGMMADIGLTNRETNDSFYISASGTRKLCKLE
jgi:hypothetical protein